MRKFKLHSLIVLAAGVVLLMSVGNAFATPDRPLIRAEMNQVYPAFRDLQKYLGSREVFVDPANGAEIERLLTVLGNGFHNVKESTAKPQTSSTEPGFNGTLGLLNDMLEDSANRFREGNKGYTFWRLRGAGDYCVSCHTRLEVSVDFSDPRIKVDTLGTVERAEFFLASRQFEKARAEFFKAAETPTAEHPRIDALRRLLVIYTRVYPDPQRAIADFTKLQADGKLTRLEAEEVNGWLESLRRWRNESKVQISTVRRAEHLIQQGLVLKDAFVGKNGTVELLRATAILHRLLAEGSADTIMFRARALRLLGVAYGELSGPFVSELPEFFLEQCIREYPRTDDARKSYQMYQHIVTLDFTGSGGTKLPDDVVATLRELYRLAYGGLNPNTTELGGRL